MAKMYKLEFPLYVRFLSAFQTLNDANLTRSEQAFMARRWRKNSGSKRGLSIEEKTALKKLHTFRKWDAEYQSFTSWNSKMDFLIELMKEDAVLYVEYVRWSAKSGNLR